MKRFLPLLPFLFTVALASAQTAPQTGFPQFGSFEGAGGPDSINRQNLNSQMSFPIVSGKGRGLDFNFAISYNSLLWEKNGTSWSYSPYLEADGSPGWTLYEIGGYLMNQSTSTVCRPTGVSTHLYGYVYIEPNGTQHSFPTVNYTITCSGTKTGTLSGGSPGGFYLVSGNDVYFPDGKQFTGTRIKDTNGNYITAELDAVDSAGHAVLNMTYNSSSATYQYLGPTGYQTITVALQSYNVKTNFGCSGITEYTGTATLPSSITYPNGLSYVFTYEPTPGFSGYVTGRLSKVTLPNGGYVQYTFGGSNDGIDCSTGNVLNLTRTINDGTTSWTWQFVGSTGGTGTTETEPQMPYDSAANQTVYAFNSSGQETQRKIYQGSASTGTLLRTINTTWASNSSPATVTTILEDNSTQSEIETAYDNYWNLTSLKEYDYGTGAPGSVLRTTTYTYLNSSSYISVNILNRMTEKSIADSTGTVQYVEDTAYDGSALNPCPTGVTQHDDTNYPCSNTTRGNPTSVTTYQNASAKTGAITKTSSYDIFGNVEQAVVNCCQLKQWVYSATTNYSYPDSDTCGATGGPQLTTSYIYNADTGQLASETDANNQKTTYGYDSMRRLTSVTRPDNSQVLTTYADLQHEITESDPIQTGVTKNTTSYLDGLGRTVKISAADASSNVFTIMQATFDGKGRRYQSSDPYLSSPQYWTTSQYDTLGRPTKRILQDGQEQLYAYSTAYITATDSSGKQTKLQLNGLGQTASTFEPDVTNNNSLTVQTSYGYAVLGDVATVTQGSQTRSFGYDGMGRLTSETTPEAGTTSYQYSNFDVLTQRTDARGVITTYTPDTLDRITQVSYNVGTTGVAATPTVTYAYGTNASQNNNGRLITMADGTGSESYSYDILGRMTQKQKVLGGVTYTTAYQYNQASSVTQITYPSGNTIQLGHDTIGRLSSVANTSTTFAGQIAYNQNFQVTGFKYANGITASLGYAADRAQLTSVGYSGSAGSIFSLSYSHSQSGGNNGEIASFTDAIDSGRSTTYTYDALGRLSTASTAGSTNYPAWGLSFTYDRYGNRTAQSISSGCTGLTCPTNSVTVNSASNHITTSGYSYDANGNMTNDGANTISYDGENRVLSSTGSGSGTYSYDGEDLRVTKTSGGVTTEYIYDGDNVLAEYPNGGSPSSPTAEYVYLGNRLISQIQIGTVTYYHWDHVSLRAMTNSSGAVLGQQGHFPFGESWYASGTTSNWKFTTYERDAESGNDYAKSRFNASRLGRFVTGDPVQTVRATDPQSSNRYPYVANDPVNRRDPSGRVWFPCLESFLFGLEGLGGLSGIGLSDAEIETSDYPVCPLFPIIFVPLIENPNPCAVNSGAFISTSGQTTFECGVGKHGPVDGTAMATQKDGLTPPQADASPVQWVISPFGGVAVTQPQQAMNNPFTVHFQYSFNGTPHPKGGFGFNIKVTWTCQGRAATLPARVTLSCVKHG